MVASYNGDVMNYALIFAGGQGVRMNGASIPKQFIKVQNKPIIIHTLDIFNKLDEIDGIVVVCIKDWISELERFVDEYGIEKVMSIVPGGETSQLSIYNGLRCMVDDLHLNPQSIVMIHDGVRPLVSPDTVLRNLEVAKQTGCAITVSSCIETVISKDGDDLSILNRDSCMLARAPQSFRLSDIISSYEHSIKDNITNFIDSATMVKYYGGSINTVLGNPENIKVTTPIDVCMLKALMDPYPRE